MAPAKSPREGLADADAETGQLKASSSCMIPETISPGCHDLQHEISITTQASRAKRVSTIETCSTKVFHSLYFICECVELFSNPVPSHASFPKKPNITISHLRVHPIILKPNFFPDFSFLKDLRMFRSPVASIVVIPFQKLKKSKLQNPRLENPIASHAVMPPPVPPPLPPPLGGPPGGSRFGPPFGSPLGPPFSPCP